jgi:hypothetical protein
MSEPTFRMSAWRWGRFRQSMLETPRSSACSCTPQSWRAGRPCIPRTNESSPPRCTSCSIRCQMTNWRVKLSSPGNVGGKTCSRSAIVQRSSAAWMTYHVVSRPLTNSAAVRTGGGTKPAFAVHPSHPSKGSSAAPPSFRSRNSHLARWQSCARPVDQERASAAQPATPARQATVVRPW